MVYLLMAESRQQQIAAGIVGIGLPPTRAKVRTTALNVLKIF